jgi:hypothetical protein
VFIVVGFYPTHARFRFLSFSFLSFSESQKAWQRQAMFIATFHAAKYQMVLIARPGPAREGLYNVKQ